MVGEGRIADYSALVFGEPPNFVTTNGTLLLGVHSGLDLLRRNQVAEPHQEGHSVTKRNECTMDLNAKLTKASIVVSLLNAFEVLPE